MKKSLLLLFLLTSLNGCETLQDLNPFEKKQVPLTGERKDVFKNGIEHDRSVPQPFNPSVVETPEKVEAPKKKK